MSEFASGIGPGLLAQAELTEHYKPHPCGLPFGPTYGRSKSLPAILWRQDNPELISGENSAEVLLERIRAERTTVASKSRRRNAKA